MIKTFVYGLDPDHSDVYRAHLSLRSVRLFFLSFVKKNCIVHCIGVSQKGRRFHCTGSSIRIEKSFLSQFTQF